MLKRCVNTAILNCNNCEKVMDCDAPQKVCYANFKRVLDALDAGDLCNYCPLPEEAKGVHCYGGMPVMCEGSNCKEAATELIEHLMEEELEADSKPTVLGCGAIVYNNGSILFGLRSDGQGWCIAGGKLENGESAEDAVRRELLEEFNLEATSFLELGTIESHAYIHDELRNTKSVIFKAHEWFGDPEPKEGEMRALLWMTQEEYEATRKLIFSPTIKALQLIGWNKKG